MRIDFSKKSTSIFEPNQYRIPFNEFKMVVTVHLTHSDEDAYTFDFLVDLSPINITPDQVNKFIETLYSDGTNQMTLGAQIVYDATNSNAKGRNDVSLDTSSQSIGATNAKPEFGTNVFLALKQFSTSFPLTRNVYYTLDIKYLNNFIRREERAQHPSKPTLVSSNKCHLHKSSQTANLT